MPRIPEHDKPINDPPLASPRRELREETRPIDYTGYRSPIANDLYDGLDEPIFRPSAAQIGRDLLEARADIEAGRLCSVEDVLTAVDEAYEQGSRKRHSENGPSVR